MQYIHVTATSVRVVQFCILYLDCKICNQAS